MKECIECGPWCPIFNPRGECVARDPGEHCAIVLAAHIARTCKPTCKTCPWILMGDLWPVCQNPDAARDGYQVDPGADRCDEHPAFAREWSET